MTAQFNNTVGLQYACAIMTNLYLDNSVKLISIIQNYKLALLIIINDQQYCLYRKPKSHINSNSNHNAITNDISRYVHALVYNCSAGTNVFVCMPWFIIVLQVLTYSFL